MGQYCSRAKGGTSVIDMQQNVIHFGQGDNMWFTSKGAFVSSTALTNT